LSDVITTSVPSGVHRPSSRPLPGISCVVSSDARFITCIAPCIDESEMASSSYEKDTSCTSDGCSSSCMMSHVAVSTSVSRLSPPEPIASHLSDGEKSSALMWPPRPKTRKGFWSRRCWSHTHALRMSPPIASQRPECAKESEMPNSNT